MQHLAAHFSNHFSGSHFSADPKKLSGELKSLKSIVRHYYDNRPVGDVWQCLLRHRRSELPNICTLAETILAVGVGNGFVDSCFRFLKSMLSDRRRPADHDTMADLLLIRANHSTWSEREREELIDEALNNFLLTRWKLKTEDNDYKPPTKLRVMATVNRDCFAEHDESDESAGAESRCGEYVDTSDDDSTSDADESDIDAAECNILQLSDFEIKTDEVDGLDCEFF